MAMQVGSDNIVVMRNSWPYRIFVGLWVIALAVGCVRWLVADPIVGSLVAAGFGIGIAGGVRNRTPRTVANGDGISGLQVRVPRRDRSSWLSARSAVLPLVPWDQVDGIGITARAASIWLSTVDVRLIDGRDCWVAADALSKRGLDKIVAELESARHPKQVAGP
jgi:hypothetical protein